MARRKKDDKPMAPCAYGCGRPSIGTLHVTFFEHLDKDVIRSTGRDGFSAYVPACFECVKGAVKITVKLPPED